MLVEFPRPILRPLMNVPVRKRVCVCESVGDGVEVGRAVPLALVSRTTTPSTAAASTSSSEQCSLEILGSTKQQCSWHTWRATYCGTWVRCCERETGALGVQRPMTMAWSKSSTLGWRGLSDISRAQGTLGGVAACRSESPRRRQAPSRPFSSQNCSVDAGDSRAWSSSEHDDDDDDGARVRSSTGVANSTTTGELLSGGVQIVGLSIGAWAWQGCGCAGALSPWLGASASGKEQRRQQQQRQRRRNEATTTPPLFLRPATTTARPPRPQTTTITRLART